MWLPPPGASLGHAALELFCGPTPFLHGFWAVRDWFPQLFGKVPGHRQTQGARCGCLSQTEIFKNRISMVYLWVLAAQGT